MLRGARYAHNALTEGQDELHFGGHADVRAGGGPNLSDRAASFPDQQAACSLWYENLQKNKGSIRISVPRATLLLHRNQRDTGENKRKQAFRASNSKYGTMDAGLYVVDEYVTKAHPAEPLDDVHEGVCEGKD